MSVAASVVINSVRDLYPDPSYDAAGVPTPDANGQRFRATTLYRWLSQAITACAEGIGWIVQDWTAVSVVGGKPVISLDSKWAAVSDLLTNKWVLAPLDESLAIYPTSQLISSQPIRYGMHRSIDGIELFNFPAPQTTDPTTLLDGAINASVTTLTVDDTTGFLSDGYVRIDNELIKYEALTATTLLSCSRGQGATTAASHLDNAVVSHCSCWIKGPRVPADVTAGANTIELPPGFIYMLDYFVLAKMKQAGQQADEALKLMQAFNQECEKKRSDPFWQSLDTFNVMPYGSPAMGSLAWGRVILP